MESGLRARFQASAPRGPRRPPRRRAGLEDAGAGDPQRRIGQRRRVPWHLRGPRRGVDRDHRSGVPSPRAAGAGAHVSRWSVRERDAPPGRAPERRGAHGRRANRRLHSRWRRQPFPTSLRPPLFRRIQRRAAPGRCRRAPRRRLPGGRRPARGRASRESPFRAAVAPVGGLDDVLCRDDGTAWFGLPPTAARARSPTPPSSARRWSGCCPSPRAGTPWCSSASRQVVSIT
jgi:hypothetical protein